MTTFLKVLEWEIAGKGRACWLTDSLRNSCANHIFAGTLSADYYIEALNRFYDL